MIVLSVPTIREHGRCKAHEYGGGVDDRHEIKNESRARAVLERAKGVT